MSRSTFVGILVLAVVFAGMFWARFRPLPAQASNAGQAPSATSPARGAAADDALPDVTLADGVANLGDVRITFAVAPQPPVAFATFRVRVSALASATTASSSSSPEAGTDRPLTLEGGKVSFEMSMPMGDHRYALVPAGDGWQEAEVVLPLCPSGKRRWYATVEGTAGGRPVIARFRLDLAVPPGK
jgi:hypothetical protein